MTTHEAPSGLVARRGELMVELFLQDLRPSFLSRPTSPNLGYDLLVGFKNARGGINTFAVEVRATERPPRGRFRLPRRAFDRLALSNVPALLLVVDVKHNRLYHAWLTPDGTAGGDDPQKVPVPLTELDAPAMAELHRQFKAADASVRVAG